MKYAKKAKKFVTENKLLTLAIVGGAYYYYNYGMPAGLSPAPAAKAAVITPSVSTYSYDSHAPIRNQPYTNSTHTFGPADGDVVFYGF